MMFSVSVFEHASYIESPCGAGFISDRFHGAFQWDILVLGPCSRPHSGPHDPFDAILGPRCHKTFDAIFKV
jgi:hypothetical protein